MKTQKNARERLIRYSILVAVMCVLTFFCSTTIHATVSSKANVDHVEGTSEAKTQGSGIHLRIFNLIFHPMQEVPVCPQV